MPRPVEFDFAPLPEEIVTIGGTQYRLGFQLHHAIPQNVYEDSIFLRRLQAAGLWSQGGSDVRTNGVPLLGRVNGVAASRANRGPNGNPLVAGVTHTGSHRQYDAGIRTIVRAFDDAYDHAKTNNFFGRTEAQWLSDQAPKIHGLVGYLKAELRNPNSGLRINNTDASRVSLKG